MYVRNLSGDEYALQATATWQSEISGNRTMSLTILPTDVNLVFINDIAEMWAVVDDDDVAHKVVYAKRQGVGDSLTVDIKAVPLFFDEFDNQRIYEEYNQHMTASAAFTTIFAGSGYNFVIHGTYAAVDWEGFGGGDTRLETFKRALNRYGAEFEINGNTIHLKALIGRDTQFQYRHRLNASNIVQEIDASGFWTYAKGYGNFGDGEGGGDWQDAKLIREYTSVLAQIPGIGLRHAPPIKDGRVTVTSVMDASLKLHVDNSLKVSVTTDIHDLRKQGYTLAQPELGDRVFLTDERIGFDAEVRVVALSITKDWRGDVTHFSITIGDEGVTKRHTAGMKTAVDNITNIVNGSQKLPYSVLDNAVLEATKALQNAQTELVFPENGGILGVDKDDPNYVTAFTSKGFGVSKDGGATYGDAITGNGVNTSLLTAGAIHTDNIQIIGRDNLFFWDGSALQAYNAFDVSKYVKLNSDGLYIAKGAMTVERPDGAKLITDGLANFDYSIQGASPPFMSPLVEIWGWWFRTQSPALADVNYFSFKHSGRYLKFTLSFGMGTSSGTTGSFSINLQSPGGSTPLAGREFSVSYLENYTQTFTIDLGVPTYEEKSVYLLLRSHNTDRTAYIRVLKSWMEG